jgi:hypothetical protein
MKILRWIAVVPVGLIVAVLILFPIHWILLIWANVGDAPLFGLITNGPIEHIERLIIAFTTPFVIIYVGALTAPTHHKETGVALAIFIALALGGVYVFAFTDTPYLKGWNSIYYGATPILNLVGIAIPLYKLRNKYQTPLLLKSKSERLKMSKSERLKHFKEIPMDELSAEELLTLREKYITDESALSIFDDELASRAYKILSESVSEPEKET